MQRKKEEEARGERSNQKCVVFAVCFSPLQAFTLAGIVKLIEVTTQDFICSSGTGFYCENGTSSVKYPSLVRRFQQRDQKRG